MQEKVLQYLTVLKTQQRLFGITPYSTTKNSYIYPKTPCLLKKINSSDLENYTKIRKKFIEMEPYSYNENLRDYQNEAISFINKRDVVAILDQQRLGKTPICLVSLKYKPIEKSILIVAPKSTLLSWEQECYTWLKINSICRIDPTKQSKKQREDLYNKNYKVYIINYNTVANDINLLPNFDCIVIDEAHRLRNFKGIRSKQSPDFTKKIINIAHKCKYRYALTGTPSPNYAYNIYPILHILLPELYTSYYYFTDYYFEKEYVYTKTGVLEQPSGEFKPGKQQELTEMLSLLAIQRKRKDYMKWLPPVDEKIIKLTMDKKEIIWYNTLYETFELKEFNINCQSPLTLMLALRQFTLKIAQEKSQYILDYIEDYPDEQIIIASMFTSYLKELHQKIPNSVLCIGETPDTKRHEIEKKFNNKDIKILLSNIDVIKEGMKLEQCNTIIITDPSLTYTDNEQLKDRIIPTTINVANTKEKQQIINLIIQNSIDEYIFDMLKQKKTSSDIINNFNSPRQ